MVEAVCDLSRREPANGRRRRGIAPTVSPFRASPVWARYEPECARSTEDCVRAAGPVRSQTSVSYPACPQRRSEGNTRAAGSVSPRPPLPAPDPYRVLRFTRSCGISHSLLQHRFAGLCYNTK
ncbi:hypothetical protein SKAU_G00336150 [Synaphobranchus kaupii]|uniref:Uncharacterized protein n=1 Tax=Synaphobranchus kaupii TaxID=118154 RepID=A0A9Q1IJ26_SYNKA|nr:hypothetical protein SKAU_G00336150 [Synaphobranchus kaupii]